MFCCRNSVVMGYTANPGNPVNCSKSIAYACVPFNMTCKPDFNARNVTDSPGPGWRTVSRSMFPTKGRGGQLGANIPDDITVVNTTFTNYDNGGCYEVCCGLDILPTEGFGLGLGLG